MINLHDIFSGIEQFPKNCKIGHKDQKLFSLLFVQVKWKRKVIYIDFQFNEFKILIIK
jgi:hypothetical protein